MMTDTRRAMTGVRKSLWEGIWAESWVTESGQPMENLEEFIPDKGKAKQGLNTFFFFFFFWGKKRKPAWLEEEEERELTGKRGSLAMIMKLGQLWVYRFSCMSDGESIQFPSNTVMNCWHFENISWAQRRKMNYKGARMSTGSPVRDYQSNLGKRTIN